MALRLKQLRNQRKLTQREVAEAIGCSDVNYSRYENGIREPSIDILIQLSDFFGVSVDYIVGKDRIEPSTLSEYEISLVRACRSTSPSVQEDVLDFLNMKRNKE